MRRFIVCVALLLVASTLVAAEPKAIENVDTDAFTSDTQVTPTGAGDDHVALVWWIPIEFWESIMARDKNVGVAEKQAMLGAMSGTSLLVVVQADTTQTGAFKFYGKDEIEEDLSLTYTDGDGQARQLSPVQNVNPTLATVLGIFKPILGNAMGNMGNNMHFYVLDDRGPADRLIDPYKEGTLQIDLVKRDGTDMTAELEFPLNCLFVPRKCPNGRDAHISWEYCPWTGKKLDD
ncbi:MAG: hypothetical protein DWQ35_18930 [Planctomycetota bacterium]|mgnify:CR=1 FL=1|nr:MAG: hypothetical protein DWQ35_18930 [Planctomycetota bacterium]REK31208.1 MAG: hypothetical protein DWQ42_00790 [Planctomycetota bacterium]